ncbi:MAG: hypothetical protein QOH41_105 [Blastocatellia bacterium]|jgi:hypothetical protein|nr:hypothetical protein [Blastocatellia bacterium]
MRFEQPTVHALTWTLIWSDESNGSGRVGADWIYDEGSGFWLLTLSRQLGTGEVETMSSGYSDETCQ